MRLWLLALVGLHLGCSRTPTPAVDPVQPPEVPSPVASGTYFADDDPPAQGEALAERPPAAETLVAQRRPATVVDLLFTSHDGLAVLDDDGDVSLLDVSGPTRAHWSGAGQPPLSLAGGLVSAPNFAATLNSGESWLPRVQGAAETGAAVVSPRGNRFVTLGVGALQGRVLLASFPEGAQLASVTLATAASPALAWAPSGRHFAICSPQRVELRNADDGAVAGAYDLPTPGTVAACSFRTQGGTLAVLTSGATIVFLDARTLAVRATAPAPEHGQPDRLAWSSDGSFVAAWQQGGSHVVVHDAVRGAVHRALATELHASSVQVGAGGHWLVMGAVEGEVRAYDLGTGDSRQLREPGPARAVVAIDPSGTRAAFASHGDIHYAELAVVSRAVAVSAIARPTPSHPTVLGDPNRAFAFVVASGLYGFSSEGLVMVGRDGGGEPLFMTDRARFILGDGKVLNTDGSSVLPVPEEQLVLESSDGHTFVLRRGDSLVVRDDAGAERATLALDADETVPCRGRACPLPLAITPNGARVVMLRDQRLRAFDATSGAVVAQRQVGARTHRHTFAIDPSGRWLRQWGDDMQLEILAVDGLRTVARTRVSGEGTMQEASEMAFTNDGRFHAHTEDGALVILDLSDRGRARRVEATGRTVSLSAAGEHWLVRETDSDVALFDAETGTLLGQVAAASTRLVLPPRANAAGAELSVVECSGGALAVRSSVNPPRPLGTCSLPSDFTLVGPSHFAFTDVGAARIVRLADGVSLRVDAFTTRDRTTKLVLVDREGHLEGTEDLERHYLVRAAGPVLTAEFSRARGRARAGISAAFLAP